MRIAGAGLALEVNHSSNDREDCKAERELVTPADLRVASR